MKIELENYRVVTDKKNVYLTKTQCIILQLLYENKNKTVKYEELIYKIYKINADEYSTKSIRKHISLLNKKLKNYIRIKNIRGVGYIIEEGIE